MATNIAVVRPKPHVLDRITLFAICAGFWASALGGALKYAGLMVGFPYFHLLPKAILLLLIVLNLLVLRFSTRQWFIFILFVGVVVSGKIQGLVTAQVGLGIWILIPLLTGLLFPRLVLSPVALRHAVSIFYVSIVGEAINAVVTLPWESLAIDFGDYSSTVSRSWETSEGMKRIAGFSGSSIDLSLALTIGGLVLIRRAKQGRVRLFVFAVTMAAIYMTTMKSAAIAFAIAAFPLVFRQPIVRRTMSGAALATMAAAIIAPLWFWISTSGRAGALSAGYDSLRQRLDEVWPAVLDFFQQQNGGWLGMGVGSLGAANNLAGQVFPYNFVDNFYLYMLTTMGLVGGVVIFTLLKKLTTYVVRANYFYGDIVGAGVIFFCIYGATQSIVETTQSAFFLGAVVSWRVIRIRQNRAASEPPAAAVGDVIAVR